jgi:hypothetical protein
MLAAVHPRRYQILCAAAVKSNKGSRLRYEESENLEMMGFTCQALLFDSNVDKIDLQSRVSSKETIYMQRAAGYGTCFAPHIYT